MMFSTPIWLIVLICLAPFVITFAVSLVIGLLKERKKRKAKKEEELKKLDDLK